MEETEKPESDEPVSEGQLDDLTPEKDPMGGGLLADADAQKRELSEE